jgi:hypothetical protein
MKRIAASALLGAALFAVSGSVRAQELGSKGDAIFGAERLFGVRGEHEHVDYPVGDDRDVNTTSVSFGFSRSLVPYNLPRVGFDYMLFNKFSLGGALGYSNIDADVQGPGGPASVADFVIEPRVGFLHMFGKVAGIWPRGGLFYQSTSANGYYSEWTFALNVECNFPIVIAPHFGILLGLAFDQSLTGNRNPDNDPDRDITYRSIGLHVGLFGWI